MNMDTRNVKKCIVEKRPKMLKEFLQDNHNSNSNSCSSSGFSSFPRRLPESEPTVKNLIDQAVGVATTLPRSRSRSRAAAEAAFSSFQKLLNAVKSLHSTSYTSTTPLTLRKSLSRRMLGSWSLKKKKSTPNEGIMNKVKVKDILRWRSFRDLVYENQGERPQPLDFVKEDYDDMVFQENTTISLTTTTPVTTSSRSGSSNGSRLGSRSSWADSDFSLTVDELPCWWGNPEEGKKWNNDVDATESQVGPLEDNHSMASEEDKEQHSPISVLDSPFREEISDEEFVSSFDQSLANVERTKQSLLQSLQWFESLAGVSEEDNETEEIIEEEQAEERKEDHVVVAKSKAHLSRAFGRLKKGGQGSKDIDECIKDMENQGQWSKYEEQRAELGVELEFEVLSDIVNEILVELIG